eukprot:gene12705-15023_t
MHAEINVAAGEKQQMKDGIAEVGGATVGGQQQQQQVVEEDATAAPAAAGEHAKINIAAVEKQQGEVVIAEVEDSLSAQVLPAQMVGQRNWMKTAISWDTWRIIIIPMEELIKEFYQGFLEKNVHTKKGTTCQAVKDEKRLIADIEKKGKKLYKRAEAVGMEANHHDYEVYGVLVILSDLSQFRVYPGSHKLLEKQSTLEKIESETLQLMAKSVVVFHGRLVHGAVDFIMDGWARNSEPTPQAYSMKALQ